MFVWIIVGTVRLAQMRFVMMGTSNLLMGAQIYVRLKLGTLVLRSPQYASQYVGMDLSSEKKNVMQGLKKDAKTIVQEKEMVGYVRKGMNLKPANVQISYPKKQNLGLRI